MKKLFFLCAFLFMSVQTQAQLYIVETWDNYNFGFGVSDHAIVIHKPDGETDYISISEDDLSATDIVSSGMGSNNDAKHSVLFQKLNAELNAIISQGYKISHVHYTNTEMTSDPYWASQVFYLSVP